MRRKMGQLPTLSEWSPRLQVYVLQTIRLKAFHDPIGSRSVPRRISQTWTIDVAEIEKIIHYLRILKCLRFDPVDDREINFLLRANRDSANEQCCDKSSQTVLLIHDFTSNAFGGDGH